MPVALQEPIAANSVSNAGASPFDELTPAGPDALPYLVLEDFVVTALLRQGRPLRSSELMAAAEGLTLSSATLREGLAGSRRVAPHGRDWDLTIRMEAAAKARDERSRRPLEGGLDELLRFIGKPLPVPVIVRELSNLRSVLPELIRDAVPNVLKTTRSAVAAGGGTYLHSALTLDAGAPREDVMVRGNRLEDDPAFGDLRDRDFAAGGTLGERAGTILVAAKRPLSRKLLGYLVWKSDPALYNSAALAEALGDRARFYSFAGGLITTQAQMPQWRATVAAFGAELGHAAAEALDVAALLRQRVAPEAAIVPSAAQLAEVHKAAQAGPIAVVGMVLDTFEIEPDDPEFVPTLQGLNDELRRNADYLPAGPGQFLLRESVPASIGETPMSLRPVHLSIRDTETDEPLDIEMSDDGLEGDAAEFVHLPRWEDVGEEVEVKLSRRAANEPIADVNYTVLYPHYKAGTLKLRRQDEEFFALTGALTRLEVRAADDEGTTPLAAWLSRESGLIHGLGEWYAARLPASGGTLEFARGGGGALDLKIGKPDKLTTLGADRIAELEALQERSAYLSLFDLLQSVMIEHAQGCELPTIWAEVNVVRRTTKRLVVSVLSAYHCFYFKQRGPKQILWRFDDSKLDQGFKRNKRKYVRR